MTGTNLSRANNAMPNGRIQLLIKGILSLGPSKFKHGHETVLSTKIA
jgi:hypothetical protein